MPKAKQAKKLPKKILSDLQYDRLIGMLMQGCTLDTACLAIGLPEKTIDLINNDPKLLKDFEIVQAKAEIDLLSLHTETMTIASLKGNAAPIQWRLERMNPKRWGGKTDVNVSDDIDLNLTINKVRNTGNAD